MDNLNEYLTFARKFIASKKCSFLANDEDAVSAVATAIMNAEVSYDGQIPLRIWKLKNAGWMLGKILRKKKRESENPVWSLDFVYKGDRLSDLVEDEKQRPQQGLVEFIDNMDNISARDRDFLYKNIVYGWKLTEIAKDYGISTERVRQVVESTLNKIRERIKNEDIG